ncbi:uncharacterized protein LOC143301309 isoform X2 [Babylonia areolata]|uniref:uncharacterized protein LOC143301263 isoform X2 n=1 Tax=Babylonia areolata TaxID=304850 RepID=UPI003FD3C2D7
MMTELSDVFTDLLQSAHETVEGVAFSPDSGVSSCSDSEPSSPVLSQNFTQLTNADPSSYSPKKGGTSPTGWGHPHSSMYPGYGGEELQTFPVWSATGKDGLWEGSPHASLPTCVSEQATSSSLFAVKGEWVETKAGFQVCHIGNGNAEVKLGGGLTYDINVDIDIPGTFPVKKEMTADTTPRLLEDNKYMCYMEDAMNNNNMNDNMMFQAYQDDNCYHNRTSSYGMNHCAPFPYQDAGHLTTENPDDRLPAKRRPLTRTERLWEFVYRLLKDPKYNPELIEWVDRDDCTFRLNNSKAIANMWGMRKNNGQMTYEKLSRALRYYYHRQILEPVLGKKLVYRFGPNATQVWGNRVYRPQGSR